MDFDEKAQQVEPIPPLRPPALAGYPLQEHLRTDNVNMFNPVNTDKNHTHVKYNKHTEFPKHLLKYYSKNMYLTDQMPIKVPDLDPPPDLSDLPKLPELQKQAVLSPFHNIPMRFSSISDN